MIERPIAFRPTLVPLVGDHVGAVVLSQIMYWHPRMRVTIRGRLWVAKPRAELCSECQITLDQYKRVVPLLISKGWIETERHLFKNKVTPHFRLTDKALGWMAGAIDCSQDSNPLVVTATNPLVALDSNQLVAYDPNLYTETTAETTAEILDNAQAQKPATQNQQEQQMDADEVMKKFAQPSAVAGSGVQAMSLAWRKELGLTGLAFVKGLTGKEVGQLKIVHKQVDDGPALVTWVIRNWMKFAQTVHLQKQVPLVSLPSTGFFCQHFEVAMQLIAQKPQPVQAVVKVGAVPAAVTVENQGPTAEDIQATFEQLEAVIAAKGPP